MAVFLSEPDFIILDEPTNNLDGTAKKHLKDMLVNATAPVLVVSHDKDLLDVVSEVAELRDGNLRFFHGNYSDYLATINAEQEVAQKAVSTAKATYKQQLRELLSAARITRNPCLHCLSFAELLLISRFGGRYCFLSYFLFCINRGKVVGIVAVEEA